MGREIAELCKGFMGHGFGERSPVACARGWETMEHKGIEIAAICKYIRVACPSIVFAAVLAPYVDPRAGLNVARLARISHESNVSDHSACWWLCVPIVFSAVRPMRFEHTHDVFQGVPAQGGISEIARSGDVAAAIRAKTICFIASRCMFEQFARQTPQQAPLHKRCIY